MVTISFMNKFAQQWKLLTLGPLVLMTLALSSCGDNHKAINDYLSHPEAIQPMIKKCQFMPTDKAASDARCIAAIKAKDELMGYLSDYQSNPSLYGQKIIQLQSKIADNKQQLAQLEQQKSNSDEIQSLKKTLSQQQQQLNTLYTVIRMTTRL